MIVTISNQYGCGALAIARSVAAELRYEYVDRQLPVVVAKRLNVTPEEVEANEDAAPSLGERWLTSLERGTPELARASTAPPFDEELLRAVQQAVREYAARGNAVIVGRGAGVILGPRSDVIRVFMYAPRDWRVEHIVRELGVDRRTAANEVDRVDKARAAYLRDWYGVTFGDPALVDLSIDTAQFGKAQSVALIVQAVRSKA
ncbi:MAG: cytidylate kinase-like family protein [Candidatus Eremiobacteraeota bacterium]|nr:cytidylate kinase-like family protein [Candidatus Eremiobacteraeota bacterium]